MPANSSYEAELLKRGMEEAVKREMDPLRVYRPMGTQVPIHKSKAHRLLISGGKRCLPGWQKISDPLSKKAVPVSELGRPFFVNSRDPHTGQYRVGRAGKPFTKGTGDFYRFSLDNGDSFDSTLGHQVLTTLGWMSVFEAYERQLRCGRGLLLSMQEPGLSAFERDARDSLEIAPDCLDGYWPGCRLCGEPLQHSGEGDRSSAPLRGGAPDSIHCCWSLDDSACKAEYSHVCQSSAPPSSPCARARTSGHEDASLFPASYTTYSPASSCDRELARSPQRSSVRPHRDDESAHDPNEIRAAHDFPFQPPCELEVSIVQVEYVGNCTVWDFEVEAEGNYELAGILHHNSGKTFSTVMEFASRILGQPIITDEGEEIPLRFPHPTAREPKLYWVIGFDVNHIGQTIFHRLFSPGLGCDYRIIFDKKLARWRSYNDALEPHLKSESRVSPPLIPERYIASGSWHMESAAGHVFKSVRLVNGATICAYPTTGDNPKMGDTVHGIWVDEDVANSEFIKEYYDRLITARGWLLWSVWPKMGNDALLEAMDQAKEQEGEENPSTQLFTLIGSENPYSIKEGIKEGLERMGSEDEIAHRDRGDVDALLGNIRMYEFAPALHLIRQKAERPPFIDSPQNGYELITSLMHRYARLPAEWTRYLSIDPSHTRTACLFGVVPPPEWEGIKLGNRIIVERELVLQRHTPAMFAEALLPLVSGTRFEAFIMDQNIGRATTVGSDVTVFEAYGRELAKRGIQSRSTRSGFAKGCNDKVKRRRDVRNLMAPAEDGWPSLFLIENKTYATQKEFFSFKKKQEKVSGSNKPTDDAMNERQHDMMAAIEYLCAYLVDRFEDGSAYKEPDLATGQGSPAYRAAMAAIQKLQKAEGDYVHLGPGASA